MKRLMPASLIAFLQQNPNCLRADLFSIFLPTGQTLNVTDGQWDITVPLGTPGWTGPTTTFYATQYGNWKRGSITSEASNGLASNSMTLTVEPQPGVTYPGLSVGILNAILNGLFDATQLYCYTVYMPQDQYGTVYTPEQGTLGSGLPTVSAMGGVETKFFGIVTKINNVTRTQAQLECSDPFILLNMKVPTRLLQTNCPWSFGDPNSCKPPGGAAAFTTAFTAASGSNQWVLNPTVTTGNMAIAGYFSQGVVTCVTGLNAGLSQTVKEHTAGAPYLSMMNKWFMPVSAGDTFSVIAGCDKTLGTCKTKFNNLIHHAGMPFIPVPSVAV